MNYVAFLLSDVTTNYRVSQKKETKTGEDITSKLGQPHPSNFLLSPESAFS